jgi:Mn-dependent DtxR family transcriptional regulator
MHAMTDESATTSTPRITNAMEDYLKAIYHLGGDGRPVTIQRLAEEVALSGPSVTNMVKRLHEQ